MWCRVSKKLFPVVKYYLPFRDFEIESAILASDAEYYYLPRLLKFYHPKIEGLEFIKPPPDIGERRLQNIVFKGSLRPEQEDIIQQIKDASNKWGIIQAPPGTGKTVLAIYIATVLFGLRPIIIVDRLLDQWVSEWKKFTNATDNDIDIVKQKLPDPDKQIYIAYVQTLMSRMKSDFQTLYQHIQKCRIGLIIYDEVHRIATGVKYAKVSLLFDTPIVFGLSATPYASDLRAKLLKYTIGDIIAKGGEELPIIYKKIYYCSGLHNHTEYIASAKYERRATIYNTKLHESETNSLITADIVKKLYDEGHYVIVICTTKKHIDKIYQILKNYYHLEAKRFYADSKDTIEKGKDRIILTTYSMGSHGFNYPQLSAIVIPILLKGKTSIKQCVGRILRRYPNKKTPIVVDLEDKDFEMLFKRDYKVKTGLITKLFEIKRRENYVAIVRNKNIVEYKYIKYSFNKSKRKNKDTVDEIINKLGGQ